jgi:hypothetical protein
MTKMFVVRAGGGLICTMFLTAIGAAPFVTDATLAWPSLRLARTSASCLRSSWMDFEQVKERQSEDSGGDDHGDGPVDA